MQDKYTKASTILTEAQKQFTKFGDVLSMAQCSISLGNILCMQGRYTDTSKTLIDAQRHLFHISNAHGVVWCSMYLGNISFKLAKYIEAFEALRCLMRIPQHWYCF